MKKLALTIAIVLGMTLVATAQNRGLFDLGPERETYDDYNNRNQGGLFLPSGHGLENDSDGTPLGSGALLLIGFGAAYASLRRKNQK